MKIDTLVFDQEFECFETTLELDNNFFDITLSDFEQTEEKEAAALASKTGEWIEGNLEKAKAYAASGLLQKKNETWLSDGEQPVSAQQFAERMALDGINVFPDGNFEIYFDNDDLFGGNSIVVEVSAAFEFTDAYIGG